MLDLKNFLLLYSKNKKLNLILAGGKSPLNYYKFLSKININWKNINFFLLDERLVSVRSKFSNYKNIKDCFKKNKIASKKIHPLNKNFLHKNKIKEHVSVLKKFKTISIVGMGLDGHFASIFFQSPSFKNDIDKKERPSYIKTKKIGSPNVERISMNLSMLLLSNKIILHLDKKKITLLKKIIQSKNSHICNCYPIFFLIKYAKKKLFINNGKKIVKIKDIFL